MEQNKIATLIVVGPFGIKVLTISLIHAITMNMTTNIIMKIITKIIMKITMTTTTTTIMMAPILGAFCFQMRLFSYFVYSV